MNDAANTTRLRKLFKIPPKVGRPGALTRHSARAIVQAIREGGTLEIAASQGGISRQTLYAWQIRGKRDRDANLETQYTVFLDALEHNLVLAEFEMLKKVRASGASGAVWILSRRYPWRWGNSARLRAVLEVQIVSLLEILEQTLPAPLYSLVIRRIEQRHLSDSADWVWHDVL